MSVFVCFTYLTVFLVSFLLFVLSCQYQCLERLISEMTYYVSSRTLNCSLVLGGRHMAYSSEMECH